MLEWNWKWKNAGMELEIEECWKGTGKALEYISHWILFEFYGTAKRMKNIDWKAAPDCEISLGDKTTAIITYFSNY